MQDSDWSDFAVLPEIHSMGTSMFDPYWAREFHVGKRHELLHIIEGRVTQVVGKKSYAANPGDTLILPANVRHRDVFDTSTGLKAFMVLFSWEPIDRFFRIVNNDLLLRMPEARKNEMAIIIDRIRVDSVSLPGMDTLMAAVRLHAALILALREALLSDRGKAHGRTGPRGQRRQEIMDAAKAFLHEHFRENVTLESVAKALDVSPFYLSHVFSEESDFTLFHYLTTLRMSKALQLLEAGNDKISAIAAAVGYDNSNYFSRVFRKHFGRSPTEIRHKT